MSITNVISVLPTVTVVTVMLSLGLSLSFTQVSALWRQPGLLALTFLAATVVPPVVAVLATRQFGISPEVSTGIILIAAAPGAGLVPKLVQTAGGNVAYAVSTMATLCILAVITVPVTVSLALPAGVVVDPAKILATLLSVQLIPLSMGLLIRRFGSKVADTLQRPVTLIATVLFVVTILLIIAANVKTILDLGWLVISVMLVIGLLSLLAGHILGGPATGTRIGLAMTSSFRNAALGLLVAYASFANTGIPAVVSAFDLSVLVLLIPYGGYWRRKIKAGQGTNPALV
jgi:BASS family bile acid:Na+ symporter